MNVRPRLNLTLTILTAFTLVFAAILGVTVLGFRDAGERAAVATADASLAEVGATVAARTNALVLPVLALIRAFSDTGIAVPDPADAAQAVPLLAMLAAVPEARAVSVGWPDGSLLQAAPVGAVAAKLMPAPPRDSAFAVRFSRADQPVANWTFLTADRQPAARAAFGPPESFRDAQWYLQALEPGVHVSTLYKLPLSGKPGLSVSSRLAGGSIVSLDITLAALGSFLRAQQVTPHTVAFLFSDLGVLLAYPDNARAVGIASDGDVSWTTLQASGDPLLRAVWDAYATGRLAPGGGAPLHINGADMLARLEPIESLDSPPVLVAVVAPRSDFTAAVDASVRRGTLLACVAFLVGLAAIALVSWRVAHPLGMLTREAQKIRRFELDRPLILRSRITEVERLADAVAAMKATLGSFSVYLPRDLVRQYLAAGAVPRLGGERVALTLMFSDIQAFTTIAETLDPMELTRIASAYFEAVTGELLAAGATIDKYIGDAVMAFWNAPRRDPDHAAHACEAVLRTRAVTVLLAKDFVGRGWPPLPTRFGVHTGDAVVGNVGSSDRMAYTAMGSMVNLASRLEGLNKLYGTQILVSETTRTAAGPGFVFRPIDIVIVKGTASPMPIHELLGLSDSHAPPELRASCDDLAAQGEWARCVTAYRDGRFDVARDALAAIQGRFKIPAASVYAARLAELGSAAVPDWSPTARMTVK